MKKMTKKDDDRNKKCFRLKRLWLWIAGTAFFTALFFSLHYFHIISPFLPDNKGTWMDCIKMWGNYGLHHLYVSIIILYGGAFSAIWILASRCRAIIVDALSGMILLLIFYRAVPCEHFLWMFGITTAVVLLVEIFLRKLWARQVLGHLVMLVALLVFISWGIHGEFKSIRYVYKEIVTWNHGSPFIVCLGLFVYTLLVCIGLKSWIRWILMSTAIVLVFLAGYDVVEGAKQETDITLQTAGIIFGVVSIAILGLLRNEGQKGRRKTDSEKLGRTRMYNRLHAWIRKALYKPEGKSVAIYGEWGSGKSYCLNKLAYRLSLRQKDKRNFANNILHLFERHDDNCIDDDYDSGNAFMGAVKICRVNIWECRSVDDVWKAIIHALEHVIVGRLNTFSSYTLNKYLPLIMNYMPGGNVINSLSELFSGGDEDREPILQRRISDAIGEKERVVLILDDIERADYEIITCLLPLIEKLRRIKKLMVICAIAKEELEQLYKTKLGLANNEDAAVDIVTGYLTKIFDYSITLPLLPYAIGVKYAQILIDTKYSDCKMVRYYLQNSGLNFETPRQIERVVELLASTERLYFPDSIVQKIQGSESELAAHFSGNNPLYLYYEYTVFLFEIANVFFPQILHVFKDAKQLIELSGNLPSENISQGDKERVDDGEIESLLRKISRERLAMSIVAELKSCDENHLRRAMEGEYMRRLTLKDSECKKLFEDTKGRADFSLQSEIEILFGGEENVPENPQSAMLDYFEYIMERITEKDYTEYFPRLLKQGYFEGEKTVPVCLSWTKEHFWRLVTIVIAQNPISKDMIDVTLAMLDRANLKDKGALIWGIFKKYRGIEWRLSYNYHGETRRIELAGIEHAEELLKAIFDKYLGAICEQFYCDRPCSDILNPEYYARLHVYDLDDHIRDKQQIQEALREAASPHPAKKLNAKVLLEYMLMKMPDINEDAHMSTTELKADVFLPLLEGSSSKIKEQKDIMDNLNVYIQVCEDSIAYWGKRDEKWVRERGYVKGATKVKKFLESLSPDSTVTSGQPTTGQPDVG